VRLKLNGAIRLQPLSLEQVYDYLDAAGERLTVLRTTLEVDDGLQSLARTPLTLGIMVLAYRDWAVELPLNPAHFLDYAAERVFLQKVGGGYIFIHRLLLEYFAEMEIHDP